MTFSDWLSTQDPYILIGLGCIIGAASMLCILMILVMGA